MKAREEAFWDKNRIQLSEAIPLDTPFIINIEPSSACNLRCGYCGHSSDKFMRDFRHDSVLMSEETFTKMISQIKEFPRKLKQADLCGFGEPLLHHNIAGFVYRAKRAEIAEKVSILTNGVCLTHTLSERLVDAGLDRILISVNGLTGADYERNTGRKVDFDRFVSEIDYLYSIKKQLQLDIKTVDTCLPTPEAKSRFFELFGDCCDRISVEGAYKIIWRTKEYGILAADNNPRRKFKELDGIHNHVCPFPFYQMAVRANGTIGMCGCLILPLTEDGLNIDNHSLKEVWDGRLRKKALLNILREDYSGITEICGKCPRKVSLAFSQDRLDDDRDRLIELISRM